MTAISAESALLVAAIAIGIVTACVGIVTIATAGWYHRQRDRREAVRARMKEQLLERLFEPEPGWESWVDGLSEPERRELRVVLEAYVRELKGTEYERLCSLAETLGIQAEARRDLRAGRNRFRAVTWLALLNADAPVELLCDRCADTPRLRAGAARVLHESGHPDAARVGTDLLVGDGDQPLAAFGLDTLYRLNDGGETPLLDRFPAAIDDWETPVLVQTLLALRYVTIGDPGDRFDWLLGLVTHDSPRVRATALSVVERHGWRASFRDRLDVATLVTDPSPSVRADTFLLLASWGDDRSAEQLRACLDDAFDSQLLAVVRALWLHPRAGLPAPTERTRPVVEWVRADGAITGRKQHVWGAGAAWA